MPCSRAHRAPAIALLLVAACGGAAGAQPGDRAAFATREALTLYTEWLGPRTVPPLTVTGASWQPMPETMDVESMVAYSLARLWFDSYDDTVIVDGVAWYLQSRVVERLYDLTFLRPGHSSDAVRFFGGSVGWPIPSLRMSRWHAGLARAEWLQPATPWPLRGQRLPPSLTRDSLHAAIEIASIERSAGWSFVQSALRAAATTPRSGRNLADVLNDAAGLIMVRPRDMGGDLAIVDVVDTPCATGGCHRTRVTIAIGDESNGKAVPLRVDFADGQQSAAWVRRDQPAREFEFESAAPYASVWLDPERTILSDRNLLNNTRFRVPASNVPVTKWLSRWLLWLEDAMLSYSALF